MTDMIQLPASELKIALAGLSKVISPKPSLPVLGCARLNRDQDGTVTLEGTDLGSDVVYQFEGNQPGEPMAILLPLESLKDVKSHKGNLGFSPSPKGASMHFSNGVVLQLSAPGVAEWPSLPKVDEPGIPVDQSFRVAFREALECASTEETRVAINSVFLDRSDANAHYIVGTDGRSLFSANSFTFNLKESLRIPSSRFLKWNGWWTDGTAELAVKEYKEESWIQFKTGPWIFRTKGTEIRYPNWKQCVPYDEPTTRVHIPESSVEMVLGALRTLPGNEEPNYNVTLHAGDGTLVLSGSDKEDNQASLPVVEATVEGLPISIALDRNYFARALKFGLTQIALTDPLNPLVFTNAGKRLVVMPLRTNGPTPVATTKVEPPTVPTPTEAAAPTPMSETPQPINPPPTEPAPTTNIKTMNKETSPEKPQSAMQQIVEHIETIKTALKNTLNDLNATITLIRQAEREKKLGDREVELVRAKLREIQSVSL